MRRLNRNSIAIILLLSFVMTMVLPMSALAAQGKIFYYADPVIFNPEDGETTTINWNFEYDHIGYVKVFKDDQEIRLIQQKQYAGNFVRHQEVWDGKDNQGNIVPNGTYTVKIDAVNDEWAGRYARLIKVTVLDRPAVDIGILPNVFGEERGTPNFTVYGGAEEQEDGEGEYTSKVEVFIDGVSQGSAAIDGAIWTLDVPLPVYQEVNVTAKKTNMVPHEETDEEGNTYTVYEPETRNLGPISVLKHRGRNYDTVVDLSAYYYGDSDCYTDIIASNDLEDPYEILAGYNLLIFDPQQEDEPPLSEVQKVIADYLGIDRLYAGLITDEELFNTILAPCENTDEPVNISTGNYFCSFDDLAIKGSFPLSFTRFYNSRDQYVGDLGMNWHHNYEYRVVDLGDGTVQVVFGDGHQETYTLQSGGIYTPPPGKDNLLVKHNNRTYTLKLADQWTYNFNTMGQLTSIVDPNNNTTELSYERMLLREIKSDSGTITIQYYQDGRIRKLRDQAGRSVSYSYTGDDLTAVTDPEGNTISYEYNGNHQLTKTTNPLANGSVTNVYDSSGRVLEQTLPDGNKNFFVYDDTNRTTTVTVQNGSKIIYQYDENHAIRQVTYDDGTRQKTFNASGKATSIVDKKGNAYSFEYDDQGNLTAMVDPLSNRMVYTYDSQHHVTSITLPDGSGYLYTYDDRGNVRTVTDPEQRLTTFDYNSQGLLTAMKQADGGIVSFSYDSRGNLQEMSNPLGNKIAFTYDAINRLKTITSPQGKRIAYEYTANNEIARITDALNNTITYKYDGNGSITEIKDQDNNVTRNHYNGFHKLIEVINPLQASTKYEYDQMGNVVKIIDALGGTTSYEYDQLNRLAAITDPEANIYRYEYDANGNLTAAVDPKGSRSQYVFDELNRLVRSIDAKGGTKQFVYNSVGQVIRVIDALNNAENYEYYRDGRLKKVTDVLGNTTSFTYNLLGQTASVTDAKGAVTVYEYNSMGQPVKMTDAEGAITQWEYDEDGNVNKVIDALGNATSYTYDALNRVHTATNARGGTKEFSYTNTGQLASVTDENDHQTSYHYDAAGNLIEVVNAAGHKTEYVYDAVGNLRQVKKYNAVVSTAQSVTGSNTTSDTLSTAAVDIAAKSNLTLAAAGDDTTTADTLSASFITEETASTTTADTLQITYYQYDQCGLLTRIANAAGKAVIMEYDANGNLISKTDEDNYVTQYTYDELNQLIGVNYNNTKQVQFTYNALGQRTSMQDWLGTTNFELDPLGRPTRITDFDNRTTEYTWGPTGEKDALTYPDGSKVTYKYDLLGRMTSAQDTLGKVTAYQYDPVGNLIQRLLPNGSSTKYTYNPTYQVTELTQIGPAGQLTDKYAYEYDPAGNKIQAVKQRSDLDIEAAAGETEEDKTYKYDALNQLTEVIEASGAQTKYCYDALGNRVRMEEWNSGESKGAINYEYDILNRLIKSYSEACGPDCECAKHYSYDNRGNLVLMRSAGHVFTQYKYDETNRLIEVGNKHSDKTSYTYDGLGNRIKVMTALDKTGAGNTNNGNHYGQDKENNGNHYGYDYGQGNPHAGWTQHQYKRDNMEQNFVVDLTSPLNDVLMIYGENYQVQRYTYGLERISIDMWMLDDHDNGWIPGGTGTNLSDTPDRLYYLQDELGSTTKLIAEDGKTSAHYNYDEFGRPLSFKKFDQNWPGPDNTFGYTGYQYDVAAGLYYAQARYYRPEIGRFISADPWPADLTEPLTLNPYPYVTNNPMTYVDPMGLMKWCQTDDLLKGMAYSLKDTWDDLKSMPSAAKELVVAIWNKQITWDTLKKAFGETFAPAVYVVENYNNVFIGDPSNAAVEKYGRNLGAVLQAIAGGVAAKTFIKVAPKLAKAIRALVKKDVKTEGADNLGRAVDNVPASLLNGPADTHVYLGVKDGVVNYVGISKNPVVRAAQHGDRFDELVTITRDGPVTRNQARAIEQAMIERNPQFSNKINSISPNRSWYQEAVEWGEAWLQDAGL